MSEIALGSWLTYAGGVDRVWTAACTRAAVDLGIIFSTRPTSTGKARRRRPWGEILGNYARDSFVPATKLRGRMPNGRGSAPEQVRLQLDASLRQLWTDHIDLYQIHRFDLDVPIADTLGALTDAVRLSKVRDRLLE